MSIWRGKSAVPSVGPDVHIKYKFLGGLPGHYSGAATEAVGMARLMIRQVVAQMNGGPMALTPDQLAVMDYYFVFGGNPPDNDFDVIHQTLTATANGLLGGGLSIKVTNQGDANGYVRLHHKNFGLMDMLRHKTKKPKSGWTAGSRGHVLVHRGAIHVDSDRIDTGVELTAKTIIHEATHKFASTADFGNRGYTRDADGMFRADGLTHDEALNNAESYARFVMMAFLFPNG